MKDIRYRYLALIAAVFATVAVMSIQAAAQAQNDSPWLETHRVAQATADARPARAHSNSWGRWYAGLHVGPMFVPDSHAEGGGLEMDVEWESNIAAGLDIGYRYNSGLRLEAEVTFRNSDASSLDIESDPGIGALLGVGSLSGSTISSPTGGVHSWSFMLNGWYDFDILTAPIPWLRNWVPYVGGGLGATYVSIDAGWMEFPFVEASDIVPAWQLGGGLAYKYQKWLVFSVDYRYFSTMYNLEFDDPAFSDTVEANYDSHNIMLSARGYF